jgi:hypothetical protein
VRDEEEQGGAWCCWLLSVNERGGFLYGEERRMVGPLTRIAPSHWTELVRCVMGEERRWLVGVLLLQCAGWICIDRKRVLQLMGSPSLVAWPAGVTPVPANSLSP